MGIRGPGLARATWREVLARSSKMMDAGRQRVEASKALLEACRLIIDMDREERAKLEPEPRARRAAR